MGNISRRSLVFVVIVFMIAGVYVPSTIDTVKADLEDGLVAYWNFDEETGTIAHDSFGTYDGTLNGNPQWVTGKYGGALEFDGDGDFVTTLLNQLGTQSVTFWFKVDNGGSLISTHSVNDNTGNFVIMGGSPECGLRVRSINGWADNLQAGSTFEYNNGDWHHCAFTHDGSGNYELFVDGTSKDTYSGPSLSDNRPYVMGRLEANSAFPYWLEGLLDEVRIYNRVLDESEINQLVDGGGNHLVEIEKMVKAGGMPFSDHITVDLQEYQSVTFRIDVDVTGDLPLDSLIIRDDLPSGLVYSGYATPVQPELNENSLFWYFTNVPPGTSISITFQASLQDCGSFVNLGEVTAQVDTELFSNTDTAIVDIIGCGEENTPPTITLLDINGKIQSQLEQHIFNKDQSPTLAIHGTASDTDGTIKEVFIRAVNIGALGIPVFSDWATIEGVHRGSNVNWYYNWDISECPPGKYLLIVKSVDNLGAMSNIIFVTINIEIMWLAPEYDYSTKTYPAGVGFTSSDQDWNIINTNQNFQATTTSSFDSGPLFGAGQNKVITVICGNKMNGFSVDEGAYSFSTSLCSSGSLKGNDVTAVSTLTDSAKDWVEDNLGPLAGIGKSLIDVAETGADVVSDVVSVVSGGCAAGYVEGQIELGRIEGTNVFDWPSLKKEQFEIERGNWEGATAELLTKCIPLAGKAEKVKSLIEEFLSEADIDVGRTDKSWSNVYKEPSLKNLNLFSGVYYSPAVTQIVNAGGVSLGDTMTEMTSIYTLDIDYIELKYEGPSRWISPETKAYENSYNSQPLSRNILQVDDEGDGDYISIQQAVHNANQGDLIEVYSGAYLEKININKSIVLKGIPWELGSGGDTGRPIINLKDDLIITSDGNEICGFTIEGAYHSIIMNTSSNNFLHNLTISNNYIGLKIDDSSQNNSLNNNNFSSNYVSIQLMNSSNNSFFNNVVSESVYGILTIDSCKNSFIQNNISINGCGVVIANSDNETYYNNNFFANLDSMILDNSQNILISHNSISNSFFRGIYILNSYNSTIFYNRLNLSGILFSVNTSTSCIASQKIMNNSVNGKPAYFFTDYDGERIPEDAGMVILNNCSNFIMQNLSISATDYCVQIRSSSNITISNSSFSYSMTGLSLLNSTFSTVYDCTFINNTYGGVNLRYSPYNLLQNNTFINDGINLYGFDKYTWTTQTIQNNTVNDKPIYYYQNQNSISIPADAGQIILANCSHFNIHHLNISHVELGIQLAYCENNTIIDNHITKCNAGLMMKCFSMNNIIDHNCFTYCKRGSALLCSSYNTFTWNNFSDCSVGLMFGLVSNNNTISHNFFNYDFY